MAQLNLSEGEMAALAAMNTLDEDMPALPSSKELFGEMMDALKTEYQTDSERYNKINEDNQKKMKQSLQDKLAMRRQRRARNYIEEKEKEEILT